MKNTMLTPRSLPESGYSGGRRPQRRVRRTGLSAFPAPFLVAVGLAAWLVAAPVVVHGSDDGLPTTGLIGFWTGNNTASDFSQNANNGMFSGRYAPGRPGGDLAFDLATGAVSIPDSPAYDFQSYPGWTVGFWFNTNGIPATSENETFLGQDNGSGFQPKWFIDYGYSVYGPNQNFVWHVNDYNTERIFLFSQPVALPPEWNQLTVVVDTSTVDFYLNGQSIGTADLPGYVLQTSAPLVFGRVEGLSFKGLMNDVVVYDRALSPQEVSALVAATAPEPSPALFLVLGAGMLLGIPRRHRGGFAFRLQGCARAPFSDKTRNSGNNAHAL